MVENKIAYDPKININKNIYLIKDDDYIYKKPEEYAKIISDKVIKEVRKKIIIK